ncbi:MAG: ATP synthase F1 subunit epsilon [Bacteroidales bacterium]|jgi:F-type H+-transporting ATPase subunit epsilon|nr:ATP synthase F1 subunit epsilon [Bacteroidales bacterium]
MLLEIISPDKKLYSGEIISIQVPGSKGSFEILKSHAPIISTLEKGTINILTVDGKKTTFEIDGGVIEAKKNKIIVLAENTK